MDPATLVGVGRQANESIPDPKGRESRTRGFFPANRHFRGVAGGAMIAIFDPCQANPGWWAKANAPSWQYFCPL